MSFLDSVATLLQGSDEELTFVFTCADTILAFHQCR